MELPREPKDIPNRNPLDHAVDHYERCRSTMLRRLAHADDHQGQLMVRALDEAHDHLVEQLKKHKVVHHRSGLAYRAEAGELHRSPSASYGRRVL